MGSLAVWYKTLGSVSVDTVSNSKSEMFYWVTIMFSQTLGTALGDWTADSAGFGYGGSAIVFGLFLAVVVALYYFTRISRTILFWAAFILTRPLGAVVGDFLDKPVVSGGLALSRYSASAVLLLFILGCIFIFPHRAAKKAHWKKIGVGHLANPYIRTCCFIYLRKRRARKYQKVFWSSQRSRIFRKNRGRTSSLRDKARHSSSSLAVIEKKISRTILYIRYHPFLPFESSHPAIHKNILGRFLALLSKQ